MKKIIYFIEFLLIEFLFILCRIFGYKSASNFGFFIGKNFGNFFRKKKSIIENLHKSKIPIKIPENQFVNNVLGNYGRILAEYPFLKDFRKNKLEQFIKIDGIENLNKIKNNDKPVVFISGHFNNFELMAMQIEKNGINLAAIYRPLNNIFLNKIMERIRKKYICRYQIKKGVGGMKKLIHLKKLNYSSALMIDQRVSQGIESDFFSQKALTTTIPAQLVKKFNIPVVPIFIERINKTSFKIIIKNPIIFDKEETTQNITDRLNLVLEKMIVNKPEQWIWSHNRWK